MSDLRDLPDLAADIQERVVAPPYDAVSRRVRARRLRGAAGSIAAAVLVVGGVAVWQNAATTAGPPVPQPAEKTPIPPTDESQWRAVVDGTDSHPFQTSGTDDGSVAVVWRALEPEAPTFALVIREADGTVHGRRLDEPVELTPVPGGWVGVRTARAWFIGSEGTWMDLGTSGAAGPPAAGDVVVHGQYGRWLYSPSEHGWSALGSRYGDFTGAYVTPDGDAITCTAGTEGLRILHDGDLRVGDGDPDTTSCLMAGSGDTVLASGLGDGPGATTSIESVQISRDAGLTWHARDYLIGDLNALAVLTDGTWAMSMTDGSLFIARGNGLESATFEQHGVVYATGDRVCTLSYADDQGPTYCTTDLGATWDTVPLPGIGSRAE